MWASPMYDVVYLPLARRDLEEAASYIAFDLAAPDAAYHLLETVDDVVRSLTEMPYRHPIYPLIYALSREVRFVRVQPASVLWRTVDFQTFVKAQSF